ncbi:transglutaminase-like cysteine peptidase [Alsobacter sp. SYSU M60028]|uniref:Transglutaminase-like cysteine peptidase n=1 Tax=Alsobacter ponti TaxID=2962936 RepID=A0ABT1LAD8_9HYPH|nr:transglutaminase-like cysteine peptidase [Alsobacter ponti]MCP8938023.1 transglutaminase-like cysteine peptidase [Alsobacter ponti]
MARAVVFALLGALLAAAPASAEQAFPVRLASATATGAATSGPSGWADFCQRYASECNHPRVRADAAPIPLTPETWRLIVAINQTFNDVIVGVPDNEHWGVVERWDFAEDGRGDCEDYVLLKRRAAIALGLPRSSLLITVVLDTHGDGHAVLTVRTDRGDFVLDNLRDAVLPWTETGYKFLKRQSVENEMAWAAVETPADAPALVASSR